jgi:hypothetical protein
MTHTTPTVLPFYNTLCSKNTYQQNTNKTPRWLRSRAVTCRNNNETRVSLQIKRKVWYTPSLTLLRWVTKFSSWPWDISNSAYCTTCCHVAPLPVYGAPPTPSKKVTKLKRTGEISDSYGDEYEDDCLLGCCTVQSGRYWPTFLRSLLITLTMEAVSSFETSISICLTTRRTNLSPHHCTVLYYTNFRRLACTADEVRIC